jgi:Zn-dependent protease
MGQLFGNRGEIVLQSLCGLAIGAKDGIGERWKRIAVSLAGPGIQFLFFGLIVLSLALFGPGPRLRLPPELVDELGVVSWFAFWVRSLIPTHWPNLAQAAIYYLLEINFYWALMNLLPIWPLDGGQVSRELFTWQSRIYGVRNSLALSLATALLVTINAISGAMQGPTIPYLPNGGKYFIIFFAIFAFESFMQLQIETARTRDGWRDPDDGDRMPWERDPDEWKRG